MVRLKAVADVMLLIGMVFGMVLIFFDFTPFWYEGDTYKVLLHTHMYSMSNTLDAAELYVETSMDYSTYQALYDVLGSGGFDTIEGGKGREGIAYWSDSASSTQPPTREQVTEAIRKRIEKNLAKYTGPSYTFTYEYSANLPDYKVSLKDEPVGFSVATSSDDANLSISKYTQEYGMKEDIIIKRPFLPEASYGIEYAGMLDTAYSGNPNIASAFQAALDEAIGSLPGCGTREECSQQLRDSLQGKAGVKSSTSSGGYVIETELLGAEVTSADYVTSTYRASALQKVTVSESSPPEDHFYPVWNGNEVSFEALELVFINKASS